jgi:predicted phosphodiesterase
MKAAFLSDIHANLPALTAALAAARRLGAERVVAAGDAIGGGPHPTECIDLLRARKIPCLRGNVENKLLALAHDAAALKKARDKKKSAALAWTVDQLRPKDLAWIEGLPAELQLKLGGTKILVTHGSPVSDTDYVMASITPFALRAKFASRGPAAASWPPKFQVLVCGHSHVPFVKTVAGMRVVNCGTVGRPGDGDPRGSFALADFPGRGVVRARIVRFAFAIDDLAEDIEKLKLVFFDACDYRLGVKSAG